MKDPPPTTPDRLIVATVRFNTQGEPHICAAEEAATKAFYAAIHEAS